MDAVTIDPRAVGEPALRVANCSGFFGDRLSGAREMVNGGPVDVLTGDWLAELTMLILAKQRRRDPSAGYARTFVRQMEETLGTCLERNIKVVANAGGLNPRGCALAIEELAGRLGLAPVVATVTGDDMLPRLRDLEAAGERLQHLDTGADFRAEGVEAVTANAYIGYRGIAEALQRGADVVITGRVADAALVVGPAAWRFGWAPDEWDRLAGAVVAGHVIECSAQATGGNFAFFEEVPGLEHCGFPIAEVAPDGSAVITKHPGTGGAVTVDTVTAQLLYEIGGARYPSPDVVCRFDTIRLEQVGDDRVRVSGTRGEPAPRRLKVGINFLGGYRNSVTFVLPGLDVRAKARLAEDSLFASVPGGRDAFDQVAVELTGGIDADGAAADVRCHLRVTVLGGEEATVGRAFADAAVQLTLASYPGFHTTGPPTAASEYGVFWPTTIHRRWVVEHVQVGDTQIDLPPLLCDGNDPLGANAADGSSRDSPLLAEPVPPLVAPVRRAVGHPDIAQPSSPITSGGRSRRPDLPDRTMVDVRLGRVYGARSGDKGGNANVGVWARSDRAYGWLRRELTPDVLQHLVPDTADYEVTRYELPNLRACNFVVRGLLGRGVAASTRSDPQAKGLGEELRAASVRVPVDVVRRPEPERPRPA
jgi:Acyclic terpene utilisation family protein AtuA